MPNDQNSSQSRRPHYHRGRRGGERRANDRRSVAPPELPNRDHVDVEQIMRDIRGRIAARTGIDLTPQQIQELAARRLEAILEPRHVKPALLEQMRRAAGEPVEVPVPKGAPEPPFNEESLYESHRGIVRTLRRLLNPILKLFFNPTPIAQALSEQSARNNAAIQREAELHSRQAEWNALHFEIVQHLVTEIARTTLEMQSLSLRLEALDAKLDFNERRIRTMELAAHQAKPAPRVAETPASDAATPAPAPSGSVTNGEPTSESARRRRRRRRGRRSGPLSPETAGSAGTSAPSAADLDNDTDSDGDELDAPEFPDSSAEGAALEPAHHFSLLQPAERYPSPDSGPSSDVRATDNAPLEPAGDTRSTPDRDAAMGPAVDLNAPDPPER